RTSASPRAARGRADALLSFARPLGRRSPASAPARRLRPAVRRLARVRAVAARAREGRLRGARSPPVLRPGDGAAPARGPRVRPGAVEPARPARTPGVALRRYVAGVLVDAPRGARARRRVAGALRARARDARARRPVRVGALPGARRASRSRGGVRAR